MLLHRKFIVFTLVHFYFCSKHSARRNSADATGRNAYSPYNGRNPFANSNMTNLQAVNNGSVTAPLHARDRLAIWPRCPTPGVTNANT